MKVAVIGGGWAGLTTAVELAAKGMNVTVFEAARRLGGRARSVEINGLHLDNGQHILIGAYRETLRLMEDIAQASVSQAAAIQEITTGMDQVAGVVQTNAATAQQAAASSEELSGQSGMLKELTANFRLRSDV